MHVAILIGSYSVRFVVTHPRALRLHIERNLHPTRITFHIALVLKNLHVRLEMLFPNIGQEACEGASYFCGLDLDRAFRLYVVAGMDGACLSYSLRWFSHVLTRLRITFRHPTHEACQTEGFRDRMVGRAGICRPGIPLIHFHTKTKTCLQCIRGG